MEENSQNEIDLREIFEIIKRHFITIIVIAVVAGVSVFAYTKLFVDKQYVSNGTIIVNNRKDDAQGNITNDEINSAKGLTSVYSIIIKSDPVMQTVIDNLGLTYSVKNLQSMTTVSSVDGTQVMRVSVKSTNPETSAMVVNEILRVSPDIIVEKVEAGSVRLISEGQVNKKAVAPNASRNAVLVFVVALMGGAGLFVMKELLDKTIKSESDIIQYLDVPLLGIIPKVSSVKGGSK